MENTVTEKLLSLYDEKNADFVAKLTPTIPRERILGVKVPVLRSLGKALYGTEDGKAFINALPHRYLEENSLHFFIISNEKDFDKLIIEVEKFLPYVDNWATCDEFSSHTFKKNTNRLTPYIDKWLQSKKTYTARFAVGMLLKYYLDDNFTPSVLEKVAKIQSEEYYVNMMISWFFQTALVKQWDFAIEYIKKNRLNDFCHNKAIQKSRESLRISDERKAYLKSLKR